MTLTQMRMRMLIMAARRRGGGVEFDISRKFVGTSYTYLYREAESTSFRAGNGVKRVKAAV